MIQRRAVRSLARLEDTVDVDAEEIVVVGSERGREATLNGVNVIRVFNQDRAIGGRVDDMQDLARCDGVDDASRRAITVREDRSREAFQVDADGCSSIAGDSGVGEMVL